MAEAKPTTKDLIITRILDAPRELVWKACTDPERLREWWGPKNWTSPVWKVDLREGGIYHYCMRSPEGQDIWGTGTFKRIDPPNELVYTDSFADSEGNVVPASHYGFESEFPIEMLVTIRFEDLGGKTKLRLIHSGLPVSEGEGASAGWNESLDKLADVLT